MVGGSGRWRPGTAVAATALLIAAACGDDTDTPTAPTTTDLADVVWVGNSESGATVMATIFVDHPDGDGIAVTIDNRAGDTPFPLGALDVESQFFNDGDVEVFPYYETFEADCDTLDTDTDTDADTDTSDDDRGCANVVAPVGEVVTATLVGDWIENEPVVWVDWVAPGDDPPFLELRPQPTNDTDVPATTASWARTQTTAASTPTTSAPSTTAPAASVADGTATGAGALAVPIVEAAERTVSDGFVRIRLEIVNADDYDPALFEPAADLDPCGTNDEASRTWLDIIDAESDRRLYGYCAIDNLDELDNIWVSFAIDETPSPAVVITLTDRRTRATVTSEPVELPMP